MGTSDCLALLLFSPPEYSNSWSWFCLYYRTGFWLFHTTIREATTCHTAWDTSVPPSFLCSFPLHALSLAAIFVWQSQPPVGIKQPWPSNQTPSPPFSWDTCAHQVLSACCQGLGTAYSWPKEHGIRAQRIQVTITILPLTSCVTLGNLLNLTKPQFPPQ